MYSRRTREKSASAEKIFKEKRHICKQNTKDIPPAMATLRGRPGRAGRPKSSPLVNPFSPLTASPLATRSPLAASAKRGLVRALEVAEDDEPAILVTGPTCAEGTNARATQDVPKMANPKIADKSFILRLILSGSGKGWAPATPQYAWLYGYRVSVSSIARQLPPASRCVSGQNK